MLVCQKTSESDRLALDFKAGSILMVTREKRLLISQARLQRRANLSSCYARTTAALTCCRILAAGPAMPGSTPSQVITL